MSGRGNIRRRKGDGYISSHPDILVSSCDEAGNGTVIPYSRFFGHCRTLRTTDREKRGRNGIPTQITTTAQLSSLVINPHHSHRCTIGGHNKRSAHFDGVRLSLKRNHIIDLRLMVTFFHYLEDIEIYFRPVFLDNKFHTQWPTLRRGW